MARIMKRKSAMSSRKKYVRKPRTKSKTRFAGKAGITRVVNKLLARKIEMKRSVYTGGDDVQIAHNNFQPLENASTFFATTFGTQDPMNAVGQRIGDEITVKGISFKMMIELNERYSDVTHKLICVRAAKGDVPSRASLFCGVTDNKMIDNFNTERYTIVFQKTFKIRAGNQGTTGALQTSTLYGNSGYNAATSAEQTLSRATRIIKVYIPGTKFGKNGVLKYENGSTSQLKFFDYHLVLYAYSNYSTNQDVWFVSRLNDYVRTMYYTDA